MAKKYASLTTLQNLVDNIKALFVKKADLETTLLGYDTKGSSAAVQENLDTVSDTLKEHTDNTDIHVTTSSKSNWNSAYTHSTSAHARTDATKVEDSTTNGNIKINGTETNVYSHPNSGVTAGTYKSVTVNAQGHVTGGSNPTTLSGFGITDGETKSDASEKLTEAKTYADTVASGKSDKNHNHDSAYDPKGAAAESLDSAKSYTDTKVANLASTSAVDTKISTHNTSTTAHNDIRNLISGLTNRLNTLANSDDTTLDQLSEIVEYIKNNKSLIDGITTNKVNVTDIINNLTTNVTNKPLSAAQGVAIKTLIDDLQLELDTHGHPISDISGLQSALDGKAASSHGTHVTYSTTAPVMDGTASVGTASTVARSDHKHPTDTSRASKTEFDTHTTNTTVHITSTERTNWNAAKTHADSAHAPSNAEKNQNAFSNIKIGDTTIIADNATDTLELVGTNMEIWPDENYDKVYFVVNEASTNARGIVQLTNSTSSTSTTTAATPSSVKAAYDLANTAKTTADGKSDKGHTHDYLPLAGGTVTGTTIFSKVQDAVADSYNSPAVVIGGQPTQAHLELDNNEIQAKSSETKAGNLFLNSNGGTVHVGFDGLKIDSEASIVPEYAVSGDVGTAELPFNKMYGRYHYIYGGENAEYGNLRVGTTGTTSTAGVATLQLGNNIATGTAHNASGKITMYGSGTAFTNIMPSDRTSGSNAVKLPSTSGTLATVEGSTKVATMTTSEYNALGTDKVDANTLYMLTDSEEEVVPQIQIITWGADD